MTSLDELRQKLQLGDRPVAVIVGAGVSGGHNGVPDAAGMLASIQQELTDRGLGCRLERELDRFDARVDYPVALDFVRQHAGPWLIDALVDEAVRRARRPDAPIAFEGDGQPEHWHLPPATVAFARLLVEHPKLFAAPVVTTNFDPLLSLAIEAAGGVVDRRVLHPDGRMPTPPLGGDVLMIHLHGYWRDEVRHQPLYHMPSTSSVVVRSYLRGCRILVVGHRGRPGSLMQGLEQLATADSPTPIELWWCFHAPEELARTRDRQLLEQLQSWGANVLFGVDAHQLFDGLTRESGRQASEPARITNEITGIELVRIPGGSFVMGSPSNEHYRDFEGPQHEVTLDDFYLAPTPVTNAQYARFLAAHPDVPKPQHWDNPRHNEPEQPVVGISWEEARAYCKWAKLELPTEAQWEYACRAGTTTPYWSGEGEASLARVGWYTENSDRRLHCVGEKEANPFGLHDMHGNVWELCLDKFGPYAASQPRPIDGLRFGPDSTIGGGSHVVRGGCWVSGAQMARSTSRYGRRPDKRFENVGFRPAQVITE